MVSLVGLMWNSPQPLKVLKSEIKVEFRKEDIFAWHSYDITNVTESSDRREVSASIMRSGGGLACVMHARRSSLEEGCEVTLTHDTNHVAGLREVYNLYRLKVQSGMSHNSEKYKGFTGEFLTDDYKRIDLTCEVKRSSGEFTPVKYEVERRELVLG